VGIINTNDNLPGDIALKPGDRVIIKRRPDWIENKYATITGEVIYPGKYAIDGITTRVSDILEKAGGVTENANVESASLIRYSEKESEDKEMERLRRIPYNELSQNELRYFQARAAEIKGIMAIDFKKILTDKESPDNIILFHQDSIHIPYTKYFVNVQGRVNNPGLVNFKPQMDYEYYISLAGGYGFRADPDETIIVKAKGQQYLAKDRNYKIEPGDNILVPPQSETTFWQIFTTALTIVTQLVTVAGVVLAIMRF
jgi:protein involved in polysaccharide export with SLBB domain